MFENDNLVPEIEGAENVEQTTEQSVEPVEQTTEQSTGQVESVPEKIYTEAEFNAKLDEVIGKKLARNTAKIRREYEQKYGQLETVLKAGTGKEDVGEVTEAFRTYYEGRGVKIPTTPAYSEKDVEILARADADDIIKSGMEEVVEETDRLAGIGYDNMSQREKAVFRTLATYRKGTERNTELAKIGVSEEVYNSAEFQNFAGKFTSDVPITEVYNIYAKMQPQKQIKPMGSMTNTNSGDNGVKDFYTRDESLKFTQKDFEKNPGLLETVERSMTKW